MSSVEDLKEQGNVTSEAEKSMPSSHQEEAAVKNKYGGLMPKKPPLISKDHERAYFDSADWALGKQGVAKPKGPLEALRPKLQVNELYHHVPVCIFSLCGLFPVLRSRPIFLQPTQQQTRYRKSPCAPSDGGEDGGASQAEGVSGNEE
ncbi:uncharacterized protein LOC103837514 isoform X2 [Brassica rapa]|uniref:uncharacterized protein LOC103837514 isoform X2 n=1 Tax=Brassica campestris TaxID=3711 RepID=UPI0004F146EF|nr:uncharacterized protein LOC103837514 isoform X2 [Brassica rapa]XP_018510120.1 uncharacterized protein LOC103837514 isoform X2 [Brassica rapa]